MNIPACRSSRGLPIATTREEAESAHVRPPPSILRPCEIRARRLRRAHNSSRRGHPMYLETPQYENAVANRKLSHLTRSAVGSLAAAIAMRAPRRRNERLGRSPVRQRMRAICTADNHRHAAARRVNTAMNCSLAPATCRPHRNVGSASRGSPRACIVCPGRTPRRDSGGH